jgi:exonuclease VII small subunit
METNGTTHVVDASSQRLLEQLNNPRTIETMSRLLERLELAAFALEAADGLLRRGEQIADNLSEAIGEAKEAVGPAPFNAVELAERVPQLLAAGVKLIELASSPAVMRLLQSDLFDRLTQPQTLAALETLVDKLPLLAFALSASEATLQRGEELIDNVAESLQEVKHIYKQVNPYRIKQALNGLPKVIDAGIALINAGLFDPEVVSVLVEVGKQAAGPYREAKHLPERPVTTWQLLRAAFDPDIRRALGVGMYIVKRYGQTFNRSEVSPPPSEATGKPAVGV